MQVVVVVVGVVSSPLPGSSVTGVPPPHAQHASFAVISPLKSYTSPYSSHERYPSVYQPQVDSIFTSDERLTIATHL